MLLVDVFAHELTFGYQRQWCVVQTYNGVDARRSATCASSGTRRASRSRAAPPTAPAPRRRGRGRCGAKKGEFVRRELEYCDDIVFAARAAMEAEADILATHAIARARTSSSATRERARAARRRAARVDGGRRARARSLSLHFTSRLVEGPPAKVSRLLSSRAAGPCRRAAPPTSAARARGRSARSICAFRARRAARREHGAGRTRDGFRPFLVDFQQGARDQRSRAQLPSRFSSPCSRLCTTHDRGW